MSDLVGNCIGCGHDLRTGPCGGCGAVAPDGPYTPPFGEPVERLTPAEIEALERDARIRQTIAEAREKLEPNPKRRAS